MGLISIWVVRTVTGKGVLAVRTEPCWPCWGCCGCSVLSGLQNRAGKCLSGMATEQCCLGAKNGPLRSHCLHSFHPSPDFFTPFMSFPVSPVGKEHSALFHSSASPLPAPNWVLRRALGPFHSNAHLTWKPRPQRDMAMGAGGVWGCLSYNYQYNC